MVSTVGRRRISFPLAFLLTLGLVLAWAPFLGISPAHAASVTTDFTQCENGTSTPHDCAWVNGNLNQTHSKYAEGMSTLQRVVFDGVGATAGNHHTLDFHTSFTKGGKHSYDFLTSWSQAQAAANYYQIPFGNLNKCSSSIAACSALVNTTPVDVPVPDDPFVSHDGSTQTRINQYEALFGNRTIQVYGDAAISNATLTLSHDVANGADTGDSDTNWVLKWDGAATKVMVQFGAHIAKGVGKTGWDPGVGAASISGSPYHVSLDTLDTASLGSQDNQMAGSTVVVPGVVTVVKDLIPASDPGTFDLQVGGTAYATGVGDGGTTGQLTFAPGTYTIDEAASTGTSLSDYTTATVCKDGNGAGSTVASGSGHSGVSLTLATEDNVLCTITNTRNTGTIEVVKDLPAGDPGTFNLLVDGTVETTAPVGDGGSTGAVTVNSGDHSVSETAGAGSSLGDYTSSIACIDADTNDAVHSGGGTSLSNIPVSAGQNVLCTITNTPATATLTVVKELHPANDPGTFDLHIDASTTPNPVGDGGSLSETVTTGANNPHNIAETAGSGSSLDDYNSTVACVHGTDSVAATANARSGGYDVVLPAGGNVTCTFTNTRKTGTLQVVKELPTAGDPGLFNLFVDGGHEKTDAGDGGHTTVVTVPTGTHDFSETAGTGTSMNDYSPSAACADANGAVAVTDNNDGTYSVDVDEDADVVCTITNTHRTGHLTVEKHLPFPNDTGLFNLNIDTVDEAIDAGDGDATPSTEVLSGTHTFGETAGTNTTLADYTASVDCSIGQRPVTVSGPNVNGDWSVDVPAGADVLCVITNDRHTGTITVDKLLVPSTDAGTFNLLVDGVVETGTPVGDGGTTGAITLPTGSHTVSEAGANGTSLSHYSSTLSCVTNGQTTSSNAVVALGTGDNVVCTFTNTRNTGHITIHKTTNLGDGTFVFDISCTNGFTTKLSVTTVNGSGTSAASAEIPTDVSCTVTEESDPNYSGQFVSPANGQVVIQTGDNSVSVNNTHNVGSLVIDKAADSHGNPAAGVTFAFDVDCSDGTLTFSSHGVTVTTDQSGTGSSSVDGIPTGLTCVVTEVAQSGWRIDSTNPQSAVIGIGSTTVSFHNTQLYTDLSLVKTVQVQAPHATGAADDNGAIVQPGDVLQYTLTYANAGNTAATNVTVTDSLPAGSEFVAVQDGGSYDAATNVATWVLPTVGAAESGAVHWTVRVLAGLTAGSHVDNVAAIDQLPSNEVSNPVASGDLTLVKQVDKKSASYGDTLTYSFAAAATGTLDQTDVVVTDVLPSEVSYVDGSAGCTDAGDCTATFDDASRTLTWQLGDVAAGSTRHLEFKATIDAPALNEDGGSPAETIVNSGVIASAQTPDTPSNDVKTTVVAVLGVKVVRQPPKALPFTGLAIPVGTLLVLGMVLLTAGAVLNGRYRRQH